MIFYSKAAKGEVFVLDLCGLCGLVVKLRLCGLVSDSLCWLRLCRFVFFVASPYSDVLKVSHR